jgi:hypothetical protein
MSQPLAASTAGMALLEWHSVKDTSLPKHAVDAESAECRCLLVPRSLAAELPHACPFSPDQFAACCFFCGLQGGQNLTGWPYTRCLLLATLHVQDLNRAKLYR